MVSKNTKNKVELNKSGVKAGDWQRHKTPIGGMAWPKFPGPAQTKCNEISVPDLFRRNRFATKTDKKHGRAILTYMGSRINAE